MSTQQPKIHILHVEAQTGSGGPVQSLTDLLSHGQLTNQHSILAPASSPLRQLAAVAGLNFIAIKEPGPPLAYLSNAAIVMKAAWKYSRHRSCILHANTTSSLVYCLPAAVAIRVPLLAHIREYGVTVRKSRLLRFADAVLRSVRIAVTWLAVSESARREAQRTTAGLRVTSMPDPIRPLLSAQSNPAPVKDPIGSTLTVGLMGQQSPEKGLDFGAKVVCAAENAIDTPIDWLIAGLSDWEATAYTARAWRLIESCSMGANVVCLGRLEDMSAFYADIDVLLLTTRKESFGRVPGESISVGTPVAIPRLPSLWETYRSAPGLAWYEPDDVESALAALAEAMTRADSLQLEAANWLSGRLAPSAIYARFSSLCSAMTTVE